MNTQTILNVVTSDLAKECGKAFAQSTATVAGVCAGVELYSVASNKLKTVRKIRAARAAKTES